MGYHSLKLLLRKGAGSRRENQMTHRARPYPPPYPVGTRVRYTSPNSMRLGDCPDWIADGAIGTVTSVTKGQPPIPGIDPDPLDGWSTVQFHGLHGHPKCVRAISRDGTGRYPETVPATERQATA